MKFKITWKAALLVLISPAIFLLLLLFGLPAHRVVSIVDRATNSERRMTNYEWFYAASSAYKDRTYRINFYHRMLKAELIPSEKQKLEMELAAISQSCIELSSKYDANSKKVSVNFLSSKGLPLFLDAKDCE